MNISGYIQILMLLYTLPMNINGYVQFLMLLYTLLVNINWYVQFPHAVIYPTYEH